MNVRLYPGEAVGVRAWEEGSVVYSPRSGETYFLDPVAAEGLGCLGPGWVGIDDYCASFARKLGVDNDAVLRRYVEQLIAQFSESGLMEVACP